jgi:formylglycine-generating enzyme required for sulfatase activity
MGSDDHYQEERSSGPVTVDAFCLDQYEVTNAQFARFVEETGYVTVAEKPLPAEDFPNLTEAQRAPGSLVFRQVPEGQEVKELGWWHWVQGADWQHPEGPGSTITGRENHPVVHIAFADALAFAEWADQSIPTEAQWEFAARGGLNRAVYAWGNQFSAQKANTWQGRFPYTNTEEDGYLGTAPVGSFPPNGYDLYDMAGNVWEWTQDWYRSGHDHHAEHATNPVVSNPADSFDPLEPGVAKQVVKGGSYLCAPNYCSRYRPAARQAQEPSTGMSHIGFRLAVILD